MVRVGVLRQYATSDPSHGEEQRKGKGDHLFHGVVKGFRRMLSQLRRRQSKVEAESCRSRMRRGWEEMEHSPEVSLLSDVLGLLPDAICVLDNCSTAIYANEIFFDAIGIPDDSVSARLSVLNAIFINQQIPQRISELTQRSGSGEGAPLALDQDWLLSEGRVDSFSWFVRRDSKRPTHVIYGRYHSYPPFSSFNLLLRVKMGRPFRVKPDSKTESPLIPPDFSFRSSDDFRRFLFTPRLKRTSPVVLPSLPIASPEEYKERLLAHVSSRWGVFDRWKHKVARMAAERDDCITSPGRDPAGIDDFMEKTVNEFRDAVGLIANLASADIVQQRERMTLNEAITKSEALAETLEIKRLFVRSVSHEIRTPLSIVMSGIYLLENSVSSYDEQIREIVVEMKSSCRTAIDILNDLLTYEKLDSELLDIEKRPIKIYDVLYAQIELFQLSARQLEINLQFEWNMADSKAEISADEHKLSQVFRNLISNAIKFTPPGGSVTVRAKETKTFDADAATHFKVPLAREVNAWIHIEVEDTGAGIAKVTFFIHCFFALYSSLGKSGQDLS